MTPDLLLDDHIATSSSQPPPQETGTVLPDPSRPADPGKRQEVLPASAATRAAPAARRFCKEGAADHQRLPGAGAQRRMAGGAVLPEMRKQPLVPRDQTRHGGAHSALGTERSLGAGSPCGSQGGQSDGKRVHPPQRPSQYDQKGGWQALF